jgi:hypothetical protein
MRKVVWAGVICIAVIALLGTYAVLAHNVIHGAVNGRSLYLSVRNESGTDIAGMHDSHTRCRRTGPPREWTCSVDDLSGSAGGTDYRVRLHGGSSCWDASGAGSLRHHISGCVHLSED